mgnify:FL=1
MINDFDKWEYVLDEDSGIGIVINYFCEDEGDLTEEPQLNVYTVPKDKVANNNWHNDMIMIYPDYIPK